MQEWKISKLCFERDTEPYAKVRDLAAKQLAVSAGVSVHDPVSHTLYDIEAIVAKNQGKAPLTMKAFEKLIDTSKFLGLLLFTCLFIKKLCFLSNFHKTFFVFTCYY